MKLINFICKNLFFVALLLCATQCKDKDESQPLTMTLYDKPLSTIQSVVEGKWKWIYYGGQPETFMATGPSASTVNIKRGNIVIKDRNGITLLDASYSWKYEGTSSGYTTYVMWDEYHNTGLWYFESIKNDTLFLYAYSFYLNKFARIK